MDLVNVATLSTEVRHTAADQVRTLADFTLPELTWFNSAPCPHHRDLATGAQQIPPCRACGIVLRKHQRVGVAWLYLRGKGLIADQVGLGKTPQAAALIAAIKQAGELAQGRRVVVICRPSALSQWHQELTRLLPRLATVTATGTREQRVNTYLTGWEILITGYQMYSRDAAMLTNFDIAALVIDDVDPLRNRRNHTAYTIKRLARTCPRVIILNATPLQKHLHELHSMLETVGGYDILGSATAFRRRYVREELISVYNNRLGRSVTTRKATGYQHLDEFIAKVAPLTLRRTPAHIDDVDLPALNPHTIYLDLHPAQQARYEQLRTGVLTIMARDGARVTRATAVTAFGYGAQICSGLATLGEPDGPGTSTKLDWACHTLTGDLAEEKTVVFCQYTNTVAALSARLHGHGIDHGIIWGRDTSRTSRAETLRRFWDTPGCRVLLGTSAIEASLNLQVARHLINIDQVLNPARMQQLAGRIRRDGSAYRTVYVHNLLARGTQEEGYLDVLRREQALADHVWSENNQLFEALSPLALLQLIGTRGRP